MPAEIVSSYFWLMLNISTKIQTLFPTRHLAFCAWSMLFVSPHQHSPYIGVAQVCRQLWPLQRKLPGRHHFESPILLSTHSGPEQVLHLKKLKIKQRNFPLDTNLPLYALSKPPSYSRTILFSHGRSNHPWGFSSPTRVEEKGEINDILSEPSIIISGKT